MLLGQRCPINLEVVTEEEVPRMCIKQTVGKLFQEQSIAQEQDGGPFPFPEAPGVSQQAAQKHRDFPELRLYVEFQEV